MERMPTDILMNIFVYVDPNTLPKCREINQHWKYVIDNFICTNDVIWMRHCRSVFGSTYIEAKRKSPSELSNFELFKSLTLWRFLEGADVEVNVQDVDIRQSLVSMQILNNGRIGIHNVNAIEYYNYKTGQPEEPSISGYYIKYAENENIIAVLTPGNNLIGYLKVLRRESQISQIIIKGVKDFVLDNDSVSYIDFQNKFYRRSFEKSDNTKRILFQVPNGIRCWYKEGDNVFLMTSKHELFQWKGTRLVKLNMYPVDLYKCMQHGFFNHVTLSNCELWIDITHCFPGAICIMAYNKLVFVGTKWGTIEVFSVTAEGTPMPSRPIKRIMLGHELPILSIQIIEELQSHRLIVLTPSQLFTVMITHAK